MPRRVWQGTALLVLGRVWGSACTLATLYLLAHHLSAEAFGRYSFYLAIFMVLDTLADFGTGQVAVHMTSHDESAIRPVLAAARRIRLASASLGVVLVSTAAFAWREPAALWIAIASLYPVTHVAELSATIFRNRIAWGVPVAMRAIAAALSLSFVLVLRARGATEASSYLLAVALGSASANGLLYLASRRHLPRVSSGSVAVRDILRLAWPLGIASLCQQAYFYIDNVFVRAILGPEPLGPYNIGVRIMSYGIMVAIYATQAALPWLARAEREGALAVAVTRLSQPLFALACFGTGLAWPWTENLLALFHPSFVSAGSSTRWLLCATAVVYAGAGLMTALVAAGEMRAILRIAIVGLAANLIANTCLVPSIGIEGAGIATLITEVVVTLGAAHALGRGIQRERVLGWCLGPLLFVLAAWLSSQLPLPHVTAVG